MVSFSCCDMYYHLSKYRCWTLFLVTMNKCTELRKYAFPDICLLDFFFLFWWVLPPLKIFVQRGSFFVKEHILANMSFLSYAQVNVFARKGRNWIQTNCTHIILLKKTFFYKQSALYLIACLISSQQRSANTAEQQVLLIQSTVVFAPQKKSRDVKSGATYCYNIVRTDGTNHYIICVH